MDLRRLADAFRAHRLVTALGVGAAILLAFLAFVRVSPGGDPTFQYRRANVWGSKITIQLTQEGFPEGRVQDVGQRRAALIALTPLYARLATTDPVRQRMRRLGPVLGGARVDPVLDEHASSLPVIKLSSFALTKAAAVTRVERQARAFMTYIANEQRTNGVAPANRVVLKILSGPSKPAIVIPRKKTLPIVVFLAMLIITTGVVLVLENLRKAREGLATRDLAEARTRVTEGVGDTPRRAPATVDPKPDEAVHAGPIAGSRCSDGRAAATASDAWDATFHRVALGDSAGRGCGWRPRGRAGRGQRRSRASRGGSH